MKVHHLIIVGCVVLVVLLVVASIYQKGSSTSALRPAKNKTVSESEDVNGDTSLVTNTASNITTVSPLLKDTAPMPPTTVTIKAHETVTINELTITNTGGGHSIEIDGNDKIFADMVFTPPNIDPETKSIPIHKTIYAQEAGSHLTIGSYTITIDEITWNGAAVTLSVVKN